MKALILGAGISKRLQPLSNEIPAPMLPILNQPLIVYIINHLKKFNINEIKITLYHLPEIIDAYLGDGEELDVKITYSLEKDLTGSASSLKRIQSYIDDTLLVHFGNTFVDIDINEFYYFHKSKKSIISYAVVENKSVKNVYEIVFNESSKIINLRYRKNRPSSPYIPAGVFLVEKEILDFIPKVKHFSLEEEMLLTICELNLNAYAFIIKGSFFKIEYPKDYLDINLELLNLLANSENRLLFNFGSKIHGSVIESLKYPLLIGSDSIIRKNVVIKSPVVIGDNVIVDEGAILSNSVILNDTYIGKGIEIENSIVYKNLCINTTHDFGIYVTDSFVLSPIYKYTLKDKLAKLFLRFIDIVLSTIGIILLIPLMLIIAIAIKIDSKGPIFFKSKRIKNPQLVEKEEKWYRYEPERPVFYLKFRTMKSEILPNENLLGLNVYSEGPYFKVKDDPRITRVGKFLRKYSLDELPLLFNVLKGDLSLVGVWGLPQPEAESLYSEGVSKDWLNLKDAAKIRFKGRLGLAGYWQSRGRADLSAEERTIHDSIQALSSIENEKLKQRLGEYSKSNSVKGYISLILDTVRSVIKRKGAY